ncbi:hypothetical protein CK203_063464 [Vitis vinifera]|uniref:Uncharacterized protein n=1 Tax=Vitis vinifera TaxID=29760 RepID=A0A438FRQ9_VITVI|nr:hypothetical protein CK203_063464 [Vitis vinifera]
MSSSTCEDDFMHCTQYKDHGFRGASPSIGVIEKSYRGIERRMTPFNKDSFSVSFESMSIRTQFSDSLTEANIYPPYMMGYGQPPQDYAMGSSSTDEDYGMFNYSLSA